MLYEISSIPVVELQEELKLLIMIWSESCLW